MSYFSHINGPIISLHQKVHNNKGQHQKSCNPSLCIPPPPTPPMYNPLFILQVLLPNLQIFQQVVISKKRSISYVHWGLKIWEMQCWYKREDSQIGQSGKWLRDKRHWSVVLTINAKSILHFNTLGGLRKKKKELIWLDHSQPYSPVYTRANVSGFVTNLECFGPGFILLFINTQNMKSGIKTIRIRHESGNFWVRNLKRKHCIRISMNPKHFVV